MVYFSIISFLFSSMQIIPGKHDLFSLRKPTRKAVLYDIRLLIKYVKKPPSGGFKKQSFRNRDSNNDELTFQYLWVWGYVETAIVGVQKVEILRRSE